MKDYKLKLRDLPTSHTLVDAIGAPSRLRLIRKAAALASRFPLLDLRVEKYAAQKHCSQKEFCLL
jgi:hypothetical protein